MKIDATRYRQFHANPEEFRIAQLIGLVPDLPKHSPMTFGRHRGLAFHYLNEGAEVPEGLDDRAEAIARQMHEANIADPVMKQTRLLKTEEEFCIPIEGTPHFMVGKIDNEVDRGDGPFILDFKTTKQRTVADLRHYLNELRQNPQVDFYLIASGLTKLVYRVISRNPKPRKGAPEIEIREIEVARTPRELAYFKRGVAMTCDVIEFLTEKYGIEKPWPRPPKVGGDPDLYPFGPLFMRHLVKGAEYAGFKLREEHLEVLKVSG